MKPNNTGRNLKIKDSKEVGRGLLTTDAVKISEIMIGRAISQRELRLIPYIHYVMVNDRQIDPNRVNQEEREILAKWREEGHIVGGASGLSITKQFWDFMGEVLFVAYVGYDNPDVFADER